MPEGDTIFRSARALNLALRDKQVTRFETAYAQLASVNDQTPIVGRTIEYVESRGKWLLIHFSGDLILITHMLMSGSWHIYRPGETWKRTRTHMRAVIATADFEAVAFNVPVANFHTARTLERHPTLSKLGPDILNASFSEDEAAKRLRARGGEEVANALLDQRVLAGIGNVFKSEVCFACGINPFVRVSALTTANIECLLQTARRMMKDNVGEGKDMTHAPDARLRHTTGADNPDARLWVYRRKGEQCRRCGTLIEMRRQGSGARSTYWCPQCQPLSPMPIEDISAPSR